MKTSSLTLHAYETLKLHFEKRASRALTETYLECLTSGFHGYALDILRRIYNQNN